MDIDAVAAKLHPPAPIPSNFNVVSKNVRVRAKRTRAVMLLTTYVVGIAVAIMVGYFVFFVSWNSSALPKEDKLIYSLLAAGTRIGAIILSIYLLQFLAHFTRYGFLIADHLDAMADAIELADGNFERVNLLVEALSPRHIGFGKAPASPNEKVLDTVKTLASKT